MYSTVYGRPQASHVHLGAWWQLLRYIVTFGTKSRSFDHAAWSDCVSKVQMVPLETLCGEEAHGGGGVGEGVMWVEDTSASTATTSLGRLPCNWHPNWD